MQPCLDSTFLQILDLHARLEIELEVRLHGIARPVADEQAADRHGAALAGARARSRAPGC